MTAALPQAAEVPPRDRHGVAAVLLASGAQGHEVFAENFKRFGLKLCDIYFFKVIHLASLSTDF